MNKRFALKSGFLSSEFIGTIVAVISTIAPSLSGSGNPVLMAIGAAIGILYKHGRFTKKRDAMEPGFTDRPGVLTSEWFIAVVYIGTGLYQEVVQGTDNHWLIMIGLFMTALHTQYRSRLKNLLIKPVDPNRPKPFENLKNVFQKKEEKPSVTSIPIKDGIKENVVKAGNIFKKQQKSPTFMVSQDELDVIERKTDQVIAINASLHKENEELRSKLADVEPIENVVLPPHREEVSAG